MRPRPQIVVLAIAVATWIGGGVSAMETDQFLALDVEIADASTPLNRYVNEVVADRLAKINDRRPARRVKLECPDVALYVMEGFRKPFYSRIARWAHTHPEVERYPSGRVKRHDYYRSSVLGVPYYYHLNVPLGRTVNVDGIYFGADKLGHFLSFGARYYKHYLRWVRRGDSPDVATRKTILWGVRMEEYFVGGWTTGVVSFGDLEANYQGLRLARSLCESGAVRLFRNDRGAWRASGLLDIKEYVNPDWDESFNPSFYKKPRWKNVRARVARHCDKLAQPRVQARFDRYRASYVPSESALLMRELEDGGQLPGRTRFSIEEVCRPQEIAIGDR